MRVALRITIDIPDDGVEAWTNEYGIEKSEVRADVKTDIQTVLRSGYAAELTGWDVTVK